MIQGEGYKTKLRLVITRFLRRKENWSDIYEPGSNTKAAAGIYK